MIQNNKEYKDFKNDISNKNKNSAPEWKNYLEYIRYIENRKWVREKNIIIHENNTIISNTFNLDSGKDGIVLDILCPAGTIMSMPGIKDFPIGYDIEKIPYLEIKLSNGIKEIDPDTRIKILKHKILKKDEELCDLLYRDISMLNYSNTDNKFKYSDQLFRFDKMFELKGEDHLKLYVIDPDIDINVVKFNMILDLWTPEESSTLI